VPARPTSYSVGTPTRSRTPSPTPSRRNALLPVPLPLQCTPRTPRDLAEEHGACGVLDLLSQHAAAPGGSGTAQLQPEAAFESWFESTSSRSSAQVDSTVRARTFSAIL
jgi:hypothetical protein